MSKPKSNDREHAALVTALAVALAGARRDYKAIAELWNTAAADHTGPDLAQARLDLLAALAWLPSQVLAMTGHKDPGGVLRRLLHHVHQVESEEEDS